MRGLKYAILARDTTDVTANIRRAQSESLKLQCFSLDPLPFGYICGANERRVSSQICGALKRQRAEPITDWPRGLDGPEWI